MGFFDDKDLIQPRCKQYYFHRIEEGSPSIEETMDVVEAGGVEVVDGEGDLQVRLQSHLRQWIEYS